MVPVLILAAVAVFVLWGCWLAVRRAVRQHGIHVLAWRFGTGAIMSHGRSHVCAPGQTCPAGPWAHMRRHHRAGLRWAVLTFTLACAYGLLTDPGALAVALITAAAVTIAAGVWWALRTTASRRHDRTIVRPLTASLARVTAVPEADTARMVRLPAAGMRRTRGEIGSITLPDWYAGSPDQRKALDHLITSHLPVEVETSWQMAGRPKRVIISAAPSPPDVVPFAQVREQIERLKPGQVLLGLDRRNEPYLGDFNGGDDPHWGFSVGSGRGKSTQLCSIGAQILHQEPSDAELAACQAVGQYPGPCMLGVDPKMTSFEPLAGVPGVELANDPRDIPGMWAAIARYKTNMEARIIAKKADPTLEFPVSLLFMDELNAFAMMTANHWRNVMGEKGTPPVWMDIASVLWMGRFVHCHGILVGQRLDEKATGGIGLRDSLGLRGLAGYRANQWKMLIGTTPVPKSQKPRGRWIYSDGHDETWIQNVYMTPEDARRWALEGRCPAAAGMSGINVLSVRLAPPASADDSTPDTGQYGHSVPAGVVWVIGLRAAADHLGMSRDAFEKARQRRPVDGETRRGIQPAWSADDLDEWAASRPRASVV